MNTFQQIVPSVFDYNNVNTFVITFDSDDATFELLEYIFSIYTWTTSTITFEFVEDGEQQIHSVDETSCVERLISFISHCIKNQKDQTIPLMFCANIFRDYVNKIQPRIFGTIFLSIIPELHQDEQTEIIEILLQKNLISAEEIFTQVHKFAPKTCAKLTESILESHGFDIKQHSSTVEFADAKIRNETYDMYADRFDPTIAATAAIIALTDTYNYKISTKATIICKNILLQAIGDGVDLNQIFLHNVKIKDESDEDVKAFYF
jgi:predicted DNA-binding protein (UPF0278 family)